MSTLRRWLERHPRAWDVGGAVLTLLASLPTTLGRGPTPSLGAGAVVWTAVATAPLVWRRRHPVAVFAAVLGLSAAGSWAVGQTLPSAVVAVLVSLYAVASTTRGRALWTVVAAAGLAAVSVAVSLRGVVSPGGEVVSVWAVLPPLLALPTAVAAMGANRRARRERLSSLEERALRLETEREQRDVIAGAAERARIAREMHDVVAHSLTVIVTLAEGLAASARARPDRAPDPTAMAALATTGREALVEMRSLLSVLGEDAAEDPASLRPQTGAGDLDALLAQTRAAGLSVTLVREGARLADLGTGSVGAAVHRIVQEALTNTLKHAGTHSSATVLVSREPGRVVVEVSDTGPALTRPALAGHGRGLRGMRERAEMLGGSVVAGPRPEGGWQVRAELPLPGAAAPAPSDAPDEAEAAVAP